MTAKSTKGARGKIESRYDQAVEQLEEAAAPTTSKRDVATAGQPPTKRKCERARSIVSSRERH